MRRVRGERALDRAISPSETLVRFLRQEAAMRPDVVGSARCRARWSASMRRFAPATSLSPSARAAPSIPRQASWSRRSRIGAHAVELNLEPSDGAEPVR